MKNKTSKYFKYAIGEIVLVVIGILIALQINNWNTENANKKIINKNVKTLISNLEKDSIYIKNRMQKIQLEEDELFNLQQRLSSKEATIDTLIKIARYEFNPRNAQINFQNENAYNTMVLSGDINLFDSQLTQAIYDLYKKHEDIEEDFDLSFAAYIDALKNYQENYSVDLGVNVINGHLRDMLWENVNAKDLIAKFDKLTVYKRLGFARKANLDNLLKETSTLLLELRKIENL
jgi:hypothetical protein